MASKGGRGSRGAFKGMFFGFGVILEQGKQGEQGERFVAIT
jgi:hypothetical protein